MTALLEKLIPVLHIPVFEAIRIPKRKEIDDWWQTIDRWVLVAALGLFALGLVLGMATSPALAAKNNLADPFFYVKRQAIYGVPALVGLIGLSMVGVRSIRRVGVLMYVVVMALVILLPVIGQTHNGATRWISLGFMSLQPSEFLKPAMICAVAWMMSARHDPAAPPGMMTAALLGGAAALFVVIQPDYGQFALICGIWAVMFFAAGGSALWALSGGILAVIIALVAYASSPHFAHRLNLFLNGGQGAYQIEVAEAAIVNGGMLGRGPGEGVYKASLPDAHSDFVIAVAAEEYGLILVLAVILIYAFIAIRTFLRADRLMSDFARIAASGLAAMFGFQAIIHIGVSAQVLPAKGMTLPFLSYGGSSLMACGIAMGMLLALTRKREAGV